MNSQHAGRSSPSPDLVRRRMIGTGLGLLGLGMTPSLSWTSCAKAVAPPVAPPTPPPLPSTSREPLNRFPRMVQEYFVRRVREAERVGEGLRNALKTREDAQQYVASVREKIRTCFGPAP